MRPCPPRSVFGAFAVLIYPFAGKPVMQFLIKTRTFRPNSKNRLNGQSISVKKVHFYIPSFIDCFGPNIYHEVRAPGAPDKHLSRVRNRRFPACPIKKDAGSPKRFVPRDMNFLSC